MNSESKNPDLQRLCDMLLTLDDLLVSCMRCGMCQAVCPVYGETLKEADVTRGKIALLENLAKDMTRDADGVNEKINRCLLCGSCQSNCPSGVKSMDIFLNARLIVTEYKGLSSVKKAIFRAMLSKPALFNRLMALSSRFQGLAIKKADPVIGTYKAPLLASVIGNRHFPPLAKESFKNKEIDLPPQSGRPRVALFIGCVADKIFTSVAEAAFKALAKNGVGIFMPKERGCCGVPALASGDRKSYDELVRFNLKAYQERDFDYLVTPCATCGATIREFWPKMDTAYSPEEKWEIKRLSSKVMDISAFLVDVLKVGPATEKTGPKVTYHDSCHLKKSLGVSAQPRRLLELAGCQLTEMPEADRCCGSGGSFTRQQPKLSSQIGQRKRNNIISVRPEVVTTGCPACMIQLMDMLSQNGDGIPVKHVVEMYAEQL
jgi:glycolate oxidase iron-sulfur subunit